MIRKAVVFCLVILCFALEVDTGTATPNRVPGGTISVISISPDSGGPGTVVQVSGQEWYGAKTELWLGVVDPISGSPLDLQKTSRAYLGTARGTGDLGKFSIEVTIPSTWSSGKPITERHLFIGVIERGNVVFLQQFVFVPQALPTTGISVAEQCAAVAFFVSAMFILLGWKIRRNTVLDNAEF